MSRPLVMGAVAYDPKVVTIWDGFRRWFADHDLDFDYVLYSHYERQVEDLVAGRIDAAWNSPLAWVRTRRLAPQARALAMRDTDRDLTSVVVVAAASTVDAPSHLAGRTVGTGAVDSPQGRLLPLALLDGVEVTVTGFDVGVGLHGDHVGGERDAARALVAGKVDAACMLDANHLLFSREGTLPAGSTRVIAQTPPFDHCNMSVVTDHPRLERFRGLLLEMDYADPSTRPLMDLEGLTRWLPGRETGYTALEAAVDRLRFYDATGAVTANGYHP
jgi:ABC-type phosphate/phosphonate transport system substrate-binding protein